jgi:predicted nucleic acid-binding protein
MERYLLDTSALVAFREDEPGSDLVEEILQQAKAKKALIFTSFLSFMEVFYCTWRVDGKGAAYRAYLELKMLPVKRIDVTDPILFLAGEIKATGSLSLADSWIAATAIDHQATLVHKDPEFDQLKDRLPLKALPYK